MEKNKKNIIIFVSSVIFIILGLMLLKNLGVISVFTPSGGVFTPTVTLNKASYTNIDTMTARLQVYFQSGTWDEAVSFGRAILYIDDAKIDEPVSWGDNGVFGNGNNRIEVLFDSDKTIQLANYAAGEHKICLKTYATAIDDYGSYTNFNEIKTNYNSCTDVSACQYTHLDGQDCAYFVITTAEQPPELSWWDKIVLWFKSIRWF